MRFDRIETEIKQYMNHMSIESAVRKVKLNHLNRIDTIIDESAKRIV